jgi:hypothetical protein
MNRALTFSLVACLAVLLLVCLLLPLAPANADGGTWEPLGQLAGGIPSDVAIQGDYAYVAAGSALTVVNVADPARPRQIGYCDVPLGDALYADVQRGPGVAVQSSYAYIADDAGLSVIDVSDPTQPSVVARWRERVLEDVAVSGAYAYACAGFNGLVVIDVSDPLRPVQVGQCATIGRAWSVAVQGRHAYVGEDHALSVVDISRPANPAVIGTCSTPGPIADVAVSGTLGYAADVNAGLLVIDLSRPTSPTEVGCYEAAYGACGVAVSGANACLAEEGRMTVLDVSDPTHPVALGGLSTPSYARRVALSGSWAYVAAPLNGLHVVDISEAADPREAGCCRTQGAVTTVALAGGYAYCASAIDGRLRIADVSDPLHALEVAGEYPSASNYVAECVAVEGTRAYVAGMHAGLRVLDVSDPASPVLLGACSAPGHPRGIAVSRGYVYAADWFDFVIIDASDPSKPVVVGGLQIQAFDVAVSGRYAYVIAGSLLAVIDVSNPSAPAQVGQCALALGAFTGSVAVAGHYAYVAAGAAGLRMIDVSNPTDPVEVASFSMGDEAFGVAATGDFAYVAAGEAGLRVLRIGNPLGGAESPAPLQLLRSLTEVAYWDTPGLATDVAVADGYVYLTDAGWGLLVFRDASVGDIAGQVRARDTTTPIAGAVVEAYREGELKATALTDERGMYRIPDLPAAWPAEYVLTACKQGFVSQIKTSWVGTGITAYVNFNLEASGVVAGQVRERGTEVNVPDVVVSAYLNGRLRATAATDSRGIYTMDTNLPAGDYVISAAKRGYMTQTKAHIAVSASATTHVNFALVTSGVLTGQVRERGTTTNLANAMVAAYLNGRLQAAATTDSRGIYVIETNLPSGEYVVAAAQDHYVTQTKRGVSVTAGTTTYVNFNLERYYVLKGQVRNRVSGAPVVGAWVYAEQNLVTKARAQTQAPYGIYAITDDLAHGTYSVSAGAPGYLRQYKKDITTTPGETTYVNFALEPSGRLTGQVKDALTGAPLVNAAIFVYTGGVMHDVSETTPPWGVYLIDTNLPAGTYSVRAACYDYAPQVKAGISVTAGSTAYVNFSLQPR